MILRSISEHNTKSLLRSFVSNFYRNNKKRSYIWSDIRRLTERSLIVCLCLSRGSPIRQLLQINDFWPQIRQWFVRTNRYNTTTGLHSRQPTIDNKRSDFIQNSAKNDKFAQKFSHICHLFILISFIHKMFSLIPH